MDGSRQIYAEGAPLNGDQQHAAESPPTAPVPSSDPVGDDDAPAVSGRLVIGIPTLGRAHILTPTVRALAAQTRKPDRVILSVTSDEDYSPRLADGVPFSVEILSGCKGLCAQRNRILERLEPTDVLVFLDDDFLLAPNYLERVEAILAERADIAMLTGTVVADGVVGAGYAHEDGAHLLRAELAKAPSVPSELTDTWNGYGCNFAIRAQLVHDHALRFDEKLPFYGWLEDVDFSGQVERYGRICQATDLRGVHLGVKVARSPGRRLGYSQIANPIYLYRKSTMRFAHVRELLTRNLASNLFYSMRPRPWADSRGRLAGNVLALWDMLRGRLDPERIKDL